jgi:hypothetical protein
VRYLTAARAAVPAALLAVLGQAVAPSTLVAFYLTAVSAAALIAVALVAYLDTVDDVNVLTGAVLALISVAAALVMIDAAISFPGALSAGSPGGPGVLSTLALVLTVLALVGESVPRVASRLEGVHARQVRELLSR